MTFLRSRLFNVKLLENGTTYSYTYNGRSIESRIWSEWSWTTRTFSFKVAPFFNAKYLINGTPYRHSFNEILIGTYTRLTQQCHFKWPWVILSDLAKYSMTRSVARSICDSWASCISTYSSPSHVSDIYMIYQKMIATKQIGKNKKN